MLCRKTQSRSDSGGPENWRHRMWRKVDRYGMIGDRTQADTGDPLALQNTLIVG